MRPLRLLAALLCAGAAHAAEPVAPTDFAWTASLDTAARQGLVRLPVPAGALARLQSPAAADLRVFDARSQPVPFALSAPPRAPDAARGQTTPFAALPLFSAQAGAAPPRGSVRVQVDEAGQRQAVWVQLDAAGSTAPAAAGPLPSALFDTRRQQDKLSALVVRGMLPPNVPVRLTLSTSTDLAHWTPVPAQGRVYRFDGAGAPANDTLELREPLDLSGRYLRLDWSGQQGVRVDAVAGLVDAAPTLANHPAIVLPEPAADGPVAREWQLGFATPIAALAIATSQANTLVPVRVLGRGLPSEPWRTLANTVVYRIGLPGQESTSGPVLLPRQPVRWLRIEATHGARLEGVPLAVRALFDPLEVVFVAGEAAPYALAAGRAATQSAALPLAMLTGATALAPQALPLARIGEIRESAPPRPPAWAAWLPPGTEPRTIALWAALGAGVLVLGAVAWSLTRQMAAGPRPPGP